MRHDDPPPVRTPLALLLVVALGAGIAGGMAAHWIDGAATEPAPEHASARAASNAVDTAAVAAELRALTQAVQSLAGRPGTDTAAPESAARAPEPLRPDANVALEAALTRLTDALANFGSRASAVAERSSIKLPTDTQAARSHLDALLDRDGSAVKQDHYFLSVSTLVERYGLPDNIEVNDRTLRLIYYAADGRTWQSFSTLDGMVVNYGRGK